MEVRRILQILLLLPTVSGICAPARVDGQNPQSAHAAAMVHFKNAAPGVEYVGSQVCGQCHYDIYKTYMKTGMARAMSRPADWPELQSFAKPVTIKHPKANRFYEVFRRGPDLFQSEYELDAEGKEVFRDEQKIAYIMGSGANGFSCIVQRGDFLFEAPLSYYAKTKEWGLSPGYEQSDLSFSRPIEGDCIFCHSGRPQPVENSQGKFKDPAFLELPIGCEVCHGPGALHVAERRKAAPLAGQVDRSIVNPAKLPGWLSDNICMYCHQGLDARSLMPGKRYADFRPGTPLADTLVIFVLPIQRDQPAGDPLLQHFIPKNLSQCYLKSEGRLTCITCHDPHVEPDEQAAPAAFRKKCLSCHTEASCTVPLATRRSKTPPDDCAGCHMPKQSVQAISHSSLTDHRIPARPGEPLPEAAYHLTSPEFPDLIFIDAIPNAPPKPLPPITLFRAYSQLVQLDGHYAPGLEAVLDSLAKSQTEDAAVLSILGLKKMTEKTPESVAAAGEYFDRAIRAGSTNPQDAELLATIQALSGKVPEATQTLQHALEVNPYSPRLYRALAALYLAVNANDDALKVLKKDLELFPEDSYVRSTINKTESAPR